MLVHKGTNVVFLMDEGRDIKSFGPLLHDESGKSWPVCSALFASFRRTNQEATDAQMKGAPEHYLGRGYAGRVGKIDLPPRSLSEWKKIGAVREIQYTRTGTKAADDFFHPFGKRHWWGWFFSKGKHPTLYKRGRVMRLELGSNCIVDDRGFVYP
jgi:hypothetical protein